MPEIKIQSIIEEIEDTGEVVNEVNLSYPKFDVDGHPLLCKMTIGDYTYYIQHDGTIKDNNDDEY